MRELDLRRIKCLYENNQTGVKVFEGLLLPSNQEIAIKDQFFSSTEDASSAVEEALMQTALSSDSHIARIYGVCMSVQGDYIVVSIAVELMERTLMDEIEVRQNEGKLWNEEELWIYLRDIVGALDRAQQMGVCHRDIKPQNLLLSKDGEIKIGDFGSSKAFQPGAFVTSHTIQGSPYFLSPLLKRALMESLNSPSPQRVAHNAFKSDVYSLGLTLLLMAKLKQSPQMTKLDRLSQGVEDAVADLSYSDQFKTVVCYMLQEDESNRPDFTQLNKYLLEGMSRPSEATTQASLFHLSVQNPQTIVNSLNIEPEDQARLKVLFEFKGTVRAKVELPLTCSVCKRKYVLDVTDGCPRDFRMIFCSQECLSRNAAQPLSESPSPAPMNLIDALQENMKQSFHDLLKQNLCVACQHRTVEFHDLLLCKKCSEGQKREIERISCEECVQCLRRWQKQSKFAKLFQKKKVNSFKLPCKHIVCSTKCLGDATKQRQECPLCHYPIPDRLLPIPKSSS